MFRIYLLELNNKSQVSFNLLHITSDSKIKYWQFDSKLQKKDNE